MHTKFPPHDAPPPLPPEYGCPASADMPPPPPSADSDRLLPTNVLPPPLGAAPLVPTPPAPIVTAYVRPTEAGVHVAITTPLPPPPEPSPPQPAPAPPPPTTSTVCTHALHAAVNVPDDVKFT